MTSVWHAASDLEGQISVPSECEAVYCCVAVIRAYKDMIILSVIKVSFITEILNNKYSYG